MTHEHMPLGQQGCISNERATTSNKVGIKYANIGSRRVKNIHLFFDISTQATACKPTQAYVELTMLNIADLPYRSPIRKRAVS
jgi:hypothetical protein